MRTGILGALLVLTAACGDDGGGSDGGGVDAGGTDSGRVDGGGGDGGGDGGGVDSGGVDSGAFDAGSDEVVCWPTDGARFPTFDRSCSEGADCEIAYHMVDCCGTRHALGIRQSERARFDAAEARCEAMYPGCGCAPGPTRTDDGGEVRDESAIVVTCADGRCATTTAP